jgi:N-acetylglucosaminyldiphosphoundecaprenol N-acetyl-beta-D-mannosaminyltransferase
MAKCTIFDLQTDAQTLQEATATILQWAQQPGERRYVSAGTVYGLMKSQEDEAIIMAFNLADMVIADGMPIVWLQRLAGHRDAQRVYGPDLMLAICDASSHLPIKHFFWGGLPGVAESLAKTLQKYFLGLQVAGAYSPPIADLGIQPDKSVLTRLNESGAQIIWVGLGSPKQDLWMKLYRPYLEAPVLIGVGAAFDFLSGNKRQAPRFLQRLGLEWLYRLCQEPRRLWKRYLIYNTLFVWRAGVFLSARLFSLR